MHLDTGAEFIWILTGQRVRIRGASTIKSRTSNLEMVSCVWEETTPNGVTRKVVRPLYLKHLRTAEGKPLC